MKYKTSLRDIVATNIKKYRKLNNLTQSSLAERADISNTYIANIECGQTWISDKTLEKISSALHIETYVLFIPYTDPSENTISKHQERIEFLNKKQEEFTTYTKTFLTETLNFLLEE